MIFGNPGIYDKNGSISKFAILVENIENSDCFSVNLCLDMNIYPKHLAYNSREYISIGLQDDEILKNESEFLFKLKDDELLIELVKMKFNDLYQIECLIRDGKIDYQQCLDMDYIFDLIDYNYETDNRFYWDIDNIEYRNVFPFIINFSGFSKVAIVTINESNNLDEITSRFFADNMRVKEGMSFFDKSFWSIDTIIIKTHQLNEIMKSAYDYIMKS